MCYCCCCSCLWWSWSDIGNDSRILLLRWCPIRYLLRWNVTMDLIIIIIITAVARCRRRRYQRRWSTSFHPNQNHYHRYQVRNVYEWTTVWRLIFHVLFTWEQSLSLSLSLLVGFALAFKLFLQCDASDLRYALGGCLVCHRLFQRRTILIYHVGLVLGVSN